MRSTRLVSIVIITILVLKLTASSAFACQQIQAPQPLRITVLPFVSTIQDSAISSPLFRAFYSAFQSEIRTSKAINCESRDELSSAEISRILTSQHFMAEFSESTATDVLIGGAVVQLPGGRILLSIALYISNDDLIRDSRTEVYANSRSAFEGLIKVAKEFSHRRMFTSPDAAILFSLVLPGSGQLYLGEPVHAAISIGLVGMSILLSLGRDNTSISGNSRESAKSASLLIALAWMFNVVDTAFLASPKSSKVRVAPFFTIMDGLSIVPQDQISRVCGVKISIPFNLHKHKRMNDS